MNAREQLTAAMTITRLIPVLAFLCSVGAVMHAFDTGQHGKSVFVGAAQQTTRDLTGTWSGTFISRYPDVSPLRLP